MARKNSEIGTVRLSDRCADLSSCACAGSSHAAASGFTLLELLLSLAITSIIVVLIFGTFRMGIRAWERGERDIEKQQRMRIVLELMRTQLGSLTASATFKKSRNLVAFEGTENRISFISTLALDPAHRGMTVFTQYMIKQTSEGFDLSVAELLPSGRATPVDVNLPENTPRTDLLTGVQEISFEYLNRFDSQGAARWQSKWEAVADSKSQVLLPLAVRLRIVDQLHPHPVTVLFPIRSREPA
jgi:general secretion pathway protein J